METTKRLYIVSFGTSEKYLAERDVTATDALHHSDPFKALEQEMVDYLAGLFPGKSFTYLTTPKVTEVEPDHKDKYAGYSPLDARAVEAIKANLKTEAEIRLADKELNSDAPYSDVDPSAV